MKIGYKTHIGMVREHNEDSYLIIDKFYPKFCVFAVADGMGGHNAGEVASKMAINSIKKFFQENHNRDEYIFNVKNIKHLVEKINMEIFKRSQSLPIYNGMGTTLTLIISFDYKIYIVHIGDSRAYKINDNGINQLTEDHSLVAELVKEGKISEGDALIHPQKNVITRALGTEKNVSPDIYNYPLDSNDIILLCTDGLINSISEGQIYDILIKNIDFQQKAELLINYANDNGGKDNITAILFQS